MLAPPTVWGQVQLGNDIDGSAAGVQAGNDIYGEAANDFSAGNGVGQSLVSISAAGDRVAIGALFNDGNGVDAGHVRTYDLTSITQKYGGGLGTAANPYLIATTDHLIELSNSSGDWGSHFLQTADLTFDATEGNVDWDGDGTVGDAAGFSPIGNGTTRFTGTYDGGGHTIANLYISRGVEPNVGLFGEINGARLHDLGLIAVEVTGFDYVGGLVGSGISNDSISVCYSTGSVVGTGYESTTGGLIGGFYSGTIESCYSSCMVIGGTRVGGLVSRLSVSTANLKFSYSTGHVTGDLIVGGLVASNNGAVTDCYSTGQVTGSSFVGGLVGMNSGTITACFWDEDTSGQATSAAGEGKSTAEMKDLFTFSGAGWGDPWHIDFAQSENSGYPNLNSIGVPVVAGSRSLGIVNTGGGTEGVNWGMANGIMYSLQDDPASVNASDVGSKLGGSHLEIVGSSLDVNGTVTSGSSNILYLNVETGGTIQPGAALDLGGGLYLVGNTRLTLTSSSTSYASLIVDGALTENCGGDCITYERYTNQVGTGTAGGNDLVASPFWNQSFSEFAAANTNLAALNDLRAFGPWDNTAPGFINYSVTTDASTIINPGRGYRAATKADAQDRRLAFTGDVNRSNVFRSITNGSASQWNLLGNPYPAYLSMQDFLTQNGHLFNSNAVAIYGYNGQSTDFYEEINNAVLLAEGDRLMAPGQGFFVAAAEECTDQNPCNVQFSTSMMRTGDGDDFINGITPNDPLPYLELKAITATQSFGTRIYFNAASTAGLDPGYDAALWGEALPDFALYTHLVAAGEGVPLGIQSLNLTDLENPQLAIPLGIASKSGIPLTLAITDAQLPMGQQVYLLDSLSGDRHLISGLPYTFTPNTDLSGSGRYYLVFAGEQVANASHDEKTASLESLVIYAPRNREELVIMGSLTSAAQLSLYDMQGRYLTGAALSMGVREQRLPLRQLPGGVYLVQIVSGQGVRAEQILLVK
ncbi:T9SS type A sorting domain-containing protein [Phaeodactylibacter luteus]|nr:T9SS type A sorting domain-containing protein [Phaeodactylibacter luteus]